MMQLEQKNKFTIESLQREIEQYKREDSIKEDLIRQLKQHNLDAVETLTMERKRWNQQNNSRSIRWKEMEAEIERLNFLLEEERNGRKEKESLLEKMTFSHN